MNILIVFGSSEGHTHDLARFMAGILGSAGYEAFIVPAGDVAQSLSLASWQGVIVAGSLHAGTYQHRLVEFVRTHREALARVPNAFVSVSLSAAGQDEGDWTGLQRCVARFQDETSWTPDAVHHAAGALRFTRYGLLKRLVMKFIARTRHVAGAPGQDHDFTDYDALRRFVLEFAARAADAVPTFPPEQGTGSRTAEAVCETQT